MKFAHSSWDKTTKTSKCGPGLKGLRSRSSVGYAGKTSLIHGGPVSQHKGHEGLAVNVLFPERRGEVQGNWNPKEVTAVSGILGAPGQRRERSFKGRVCSYMKQNKTLAHDSELIFECLD